MIDLSTLVSQLSDEARAQWEALVEADDDERISLGIRDELSEVVQPLRIRRDDCCGCGDDNCEFHRRAEPLATAELIQLADCERTLAELTEHIQKLHREKRAHAKWLDERGLLDGLWRALWAERHARGE